MWRQQTIREPIECTGIGVHRGEPVSLTLRPAPANQGVLFVRTDLPGRPTIPARLAHVADSRLNTTLAAGPAAVMTVEHLLSATAGMGVDNLTVEVGGPEMAIMDGSAAPFVMMINAVGLKPLDEPRQVIRVLKPLRVNLDGRSVEIRPAEATTVSCSIEFNHPLLKGQDLSVTLNPQTFHREISRARTFGFLDDVEKMRRAGLARGGSLDNAIVIDRFKILNPGGLRFKDEFVRHKILDLIGDLALLGKPLLGHVQAHKTGHSLNHLLMRELLSRPSAWEVVTLGPEWSPALEPRDDEEFILSHVARLAKPAAA